MNETVQALQRQARIRQSPQGPHRNPVSSGTENFASTLEKASLQFSNHAQNRLAHRKINLSRDGLNRLNQAVDQAAQRGGKESLVLMDDLAFLVNVQERKVITAMNTRSDRQNVFTQIDSVVLADQ